MFESVDDIIQNMEKYIQNIPENQEITKEYIIEQLSKFDYENIELVTLVLIIYSGKILEIFHYPKLKILKSIINDSKIVENYDIKIHEIVLDVNDNILNGDIVLYFQKVKEALGV